MALDKCSGDRPIGIGEVVRRIIGKAVLAVTGPHVQEVIRALQVCGGQRGGSEAAVHAMRHVFQDTNTEAVMLVDAIYKCLQFPKQTGCPTGCLASLPVNCPFNCEHVPSRYPACVDGEVTYSREGTAQGGPLAMAMYAIVTLPLIHKLDELSQVKQAWFADNAFVGGQLLCLKHWRDTLEEIGPDFRYHANANKLWLIVKEEHTAWAAQLFQGTGMQITREGQRHLWLQWGLRHLLRHM